MVRAVEALFDAQGYANTTIEQIAQRLGVTKPFVYCYDRHCALLNERRRDGMFEFNDTKVTALAACRLSGFLYHWYRSDGRLAPDELVQELAHLAWRVLGLRRKCRRLTQ